MLSEKTHTSEEIRKEWKHYFTVGDLKKLLSENEIPDDAKIFIQRVEDIYFEKYNWGTIKIESDEYHYQKMLIDKAKPNGEFHDKEKYPKMTEQIIHEILESEKELENLKDEYIPVWCGFLYKEDKNGIYFAAHY